MDGRKRPSGGRIGGSQVERPPSEQDDVQQRRVQEVFQVERFLVGRLEAGELLLGESNVLVRLIRIPLDDLVRGNLPVLRTALTILDPLSAGGMELPQIGEMLMQHIEKLKEQLT